MHVIGRAREIRPTSEVGPGRLLAVLAWLMAFSALSTDLYLPAMPRMAAALFAAPGLIELTVGGYLLGFVVGQLSWGPIGDAKGRKKPMAVGLGLFTLASVGCALASTAHEMIFWRVIQGAGASACVVLARAIVRDRFTGDESARVLSTLLAIMALSPLAGPLLGSALLHIVGWRPIFWLLAIAGLASIPLLASLPQDPQPVVRPPRAGVLALYLAMGRQRVMRAYIGIGAFFYAGLFAFISASPGIFISGFGFSPTTYAWLLALGTSAIIASNLVNARMVGTLGCRKALEIGTVIAFCAAVAALGLTLAYPANPSLLVASLIFFMTSGGFIVGNSIAGALDRFPENAGAASAFSGSIQYAGGVAGSVAVAAMHDGTALPLAIVLAASACGMMVCGASLAASRRSTLG